MKILRVDMNNLTTRFEELPEDWIVVGGRGLSARILNKEVSPSTNPLAAEAKLVIAGGPLAGTLAPSCGRISVGAKSPLTMGIKETNAGGPVAQKLDKLGIRAIVLEGAAPGGKLFLLVINKNGAVLEEGGVYKGMQNYALVQSLGKYGNNAAVISIGPAGERKWKSASVAFTDKDGHPSRHAGRGGLGAVMGSKGVKAIVVDDSGASPVPLLDKDAFRQAIKKWSTVMKEDTQLQIFSRFGTPFGVAPLRELGSMPSKNYSSEPTEGFEKISGESIEKICKERGGHMDGCMPGCIVKCSIIYNDADKEHLTSALEYETVALLGTNLGIVEPDVLAKMDRFCDEMGIDTIELGAALGIAASAGKMEMGNAESALALMKEVEEGTELGTILGNGVVSACKALGISRVPAFKGQAMPAHDARVCKTVGVTYATSPMGADHTAGISYKDPISKEGQVERSLSTQILAAMEDSMGYCLIARPGNLEAYLAFLKDLINARYGLNLREEDLKEIGQQALRDELRFNEGAEFNTVHGPDPEFIRKEPLAPTGSVFDVEPSEIASIWQKL
jgi:aldehyde:ferredoxin oxidoreductase